MQEASPRCSGERLFPGLEAGKSTSLADAGNAGGGNRVLNGRDLQGSCG
jgi:hypothetical protein